jgi:hypothetical protein
VKFALISLGVFIVASMFFMGEAAWLILLCVFVGRAAFSSWHRVLRCGVVAAGVAVLVAHFAGYKFYGSATVHDNRPVLDSPHQLASLVAPNTIVAADGTRLEVQGVTFTPALLALPAENLQRLLSRLPEPVLIQPDPSSPSGVVFQRRCDYWCGNTFFPAFIPRRLPAYSKKDMGQYLTGYKLATAQNSK